MQPNEIGKTCTGEPGRRDAFHAPCILASGNSVLPGDNVKFIDSNFTRVVRCTVAERHGIADPFVESIPENHNFWVFLNPNSTTNLSHHFDLTIPTPENEIITFKFPDHLREDEDRYYEYGDYEKDNSCKGCY